MQATSSKLQRSELSVNAAQLELDNLKAHVREQDNVIVGLHEQLQANQALLGTISRAANQHAKPTGEPSTTLFCLSCQVVCSACCVTLMLEVFRSDQISRHMAIHVLMRCYRAISSCQRKPFRPQERVRDQEEPCAQEQHSIQAHSQGNQYFVCSADSIQMVPAILASH